MVAELARAGKKMVFSGAGTKLGRVEGERVGTAKLAKIVEYIPSDQVVTVQAGVPLAALQEALRGERQRLSLDPPFGARATLGGIVATGSFGPRRARSGAVRDLILGATMVRADGVVAKSGGKVVKNVAGFDLPKLLCGSFGTLGLIATATFRVHPLPETSAVLRATGVSSEGVLALVKRVREAQLEPAAWVATRTAPGRFDVDLLFEGFEAGVNQQAKKLADLTRVDPAVFDEHAKLREALPVQLRALPTELPAVERSATGRFTWYPTLGLGFADGPPQPPPAPKARALHDAVKQRFDPQGLLPSLP